MPPPTLARLGGGPHPLAGSHSAAVVWPRDLFASTSLCGLRMGGGKGCGLGAGWLGQRLGNGWELGKLGQPAARCDQPAAYLPVGRWATPGGREARPWEQQMQQIQQQQQQQQQSTSDGREPLVICPPTNSHLSETLKMELKTETL